MADPRIKQIKIKCSVVKRLSKEKNMYEKEIDREKERLVKIKADVTKDEYNVRKQEEVLQETIMMVPDCQKRLTAAYNDLKNILESEQDLIENEDYQTAKQTLEELSSVIS